LAKRTERSDVLGGMQIGATLMLNLADPGNFFMVVKDFGSKKVYFAREQHAHDQGVDPGAVPRFSPAAQPDGFALFLVCP